MSEGGFILANVIADIPIVLNLIENEKVQFGAPPLGHAIHDALTHNFIGALIVGIILGLLAFKKQGWFIGCVLGSITHVVLDMFVHSDVTPFAPLTNWNPFYQAWAYDWFSGVLLFAFAFWLLEILDAHKSRKNFLTEHGKPKV